MEPRYALLSIFVIVSASRVARSDPSPRIVLPQGPITGIRIFSGSRTSVIAYLGIPYALPPIGDLRFAPPARHPGWNTTLFAGHFRPDCPQLAQDDQDLTEEDCLYLNVFVPQLDTTYRNLAVAVFIHGIEYVSGSPLMVSAEELASEGVIVVTVGYRLNVFGFLTLEDDYARGNLGILDQYMALLWVKENIKYLGGSPSNITLIGHSSGASSVMVHLTSPRTKDLFHRAILMSGSIFSPWLRSNSKNSPVLTLSRRIAKSLGCYGEKFPQRNSHTSRVVISCLRKKSKDEILRAFHSSYMNGNWSEMLVPIADDFLSPENQYLPMDPVQAIQSGQYHRVPMIAGITTNEGVLTLHKWKDLISGREEDIRYFVDTTAITDILSKYGFNTSECRSLVKWNYFGKDHSSAVLQQLLKLYNDAIYTAPFAQQLRVLSSQEVPMFVYRFTHPSFEYLGNYGQMLNLSEAAHGAELSFLFGPALYQKVAGRRFTASEERLSIRMKRLWTSFIRTGNPNPYAMSGWEKYGKEGNHLKLYVDPETGETMRKEVKPVGEEPDSLWNDLLPKIHNMTAERNRRWENLLVFTGGTSISAAGGCSSYKNAMFTILAFLIVLLFALVLSLILLKKRTKERDRHIL